MARSSLVARLRIQQKIGSMLRRAHPPKHLRYLLFIAKADGVPGLIRTGDPLLRRQMLYPAELQGRFNEHGREGEIRTRDLLVPNQTR